MSDEPGAISEIEADRSMEGWDGVTYVVSAAERRCLPDCEGRLAVATQAIGQPFRNFDLHDVACPKMHGGPCCCGLASVFTNDRWVASVDMFHAVQEIHRLN